MKGNTLTRREGRDSVVIAIQFHLRSSSSSEYERALAHLPRRFIFEVLLLFGCRSLQQRVSELDLELPFIWSERCRWT